jgi:hypothetical protein
MALQKTDKKDWKDEAQKHAATPAAAPPILSLEEFVEKFTIRYDSEDSFKEMVHKYLNVSTIKKAALGVGKHIFKGWYEKETDKIIMSYAERIRTEIVEAAKLLEDNDSLRAASCTYEKADSELKQVEQQQLEAKQGLDEAVNEMAAKLDETKDKYRTLIQEEKGAAEKTKEEIKKATDADRIVKDTLNRYIKKSGLFVVGGDGRLGFDETILSKKFEDLYLKEIIDGMASEGDTGFMSRMREAYEGIVTHVEELEDISEIDNLEIVESIIHSRTRGYRRPVFPYLMVGKFESQEALRTTIDTATSTDISGSMSENGRIIVAKKTNLAISALMRKLNPKHNHYQSVFNLYLKEVDTIDIIKNVSADGGTNTHLAIDWFIEKLKDSGMSIANLITDGAPNTPELAYEAAKRMRDYPNILLRIYLIDGDKETEKIVRNIGKYAGNSTKVIPLKNYQLAGGVLKGLEESLIQMYSISNF